MQLEEALRAVRAELARAQLMYQAFHSAHQGYAVILEEMDELWSEVRANQRDVGRIQKEVRQVAAMALRFLLDLC